MKLKIYSRLTKLTNKQLTHAWFWAFKMKRALSTNRKWFPDREAKVSYYKFKDKIKVAIISSIYATTKEPLHKYMLHLYKESVRRGLKFNQELIDN